MRRQLQGPGSQTPAQQWTHCHHWSLVPTGPMMVTSPLLTRQQRGVLAVVGAFLLQLVAGSYNGTFGNLLPYLTSYLRQVGQGIFVLRR